MTKSKRKEPSKKAVKKKLPFPGPQNHRRGFEQLLDDAIFGVKKK